jgi:hypothetical protein
MPDAGASRKRDMSRYIKSAVGAGKVLGAPAGPCRKCDTCADSRPSRARPARSASRVRVGRADEAEHAVTTGLRDAMKESSAHRSPSEFSIPDRRPAQSHRRPGSKFALQNRGFPASSCGREDGGFHHRHVGDSTLRSSAKRRLCAIDSRTGFAARRVGLGRRTEAPASFAMQARADGAFQKRYDMTVTYGEIFMSPACYLCNTHPKRG